jgi:eukaryotic-like serine/threonine-protein kinase
LPSFVVFWKHPTCDAVDHIVGVCNDDLNFVPALIDHEKGGDCQASTSEHIGAGAISIYLVGASQLSIGDVAVHAGPSFSRKIAFPVEMAAAYEAHGALRETLFGNPAAARDQAANAPQLSNSADVESFSALALAIAGDTARAETLADDLDSRFPEHTIVQLYYLPTLRAQFALTRNDPSNAIEVLQAATPYDLSSSGALYPVYLRGEAYLAAHQGAEATAQFQKTLDHRGIVVNDSIGALAQLQLGRANAVFGDRAKEKMAYQDFLTLWKDADPDIPILKQAKAEYAKLR